MKAIRLLLAALLIPFFVTSCATSTPPGSAREAMIRPEAERIRWPERYRPDKATFFVHNEIEIAAPADVVWKILTDVEAWPEWYDGASGIRLIGAKSGKLERGGSFTLRTMGLNFIAQVKEFEPPYRLATENRKRVIQGYHAWLIVPTKTGCKVITDESFRGFLAVMQRTFIPNKLHGLHEDFLTGLKRRAEAKAKAGGTGR